MRPIDADALLEAIEKERQYLLARGQMGAEHILVHNFRNLVEEAPTVESVINMYPNGEVIVQDKRPRGRWIRCGWSIRCSICNYDMPYSVRNFCPNCGADMRGT